MSTDFWGTRHRINGGDPVGPKTGPDGAKTRFCAVVSGSGPKGLEHRWIASTPCCLGEPTALTSCLKLLDALEDLDDVRSVTSNLEADEALMEAAFS